MIPTDPRIAPLVRDLAARAVVDALRDAVRRGCITVTPEVPQ